MKEVQQAEALRLADICASKGLSAVEDELRAQHARIAELEAELEAVGAGGVEPLRKGFVRLTDVLARLEQGFGANSAPVTTIKRHFEMQAAPAHPAEGVQPSLEQDVRAIVGLLKNREWAEHIGQTELGRELEHEITNLYNSTNPTQQGLDAQAEAARSVFAERARQIADEGYTPEQDDGYNPGVLALHGGLYACHAYDNLTKKRVPEGWQWDEKWWKPKDPRTNLVMAGALILAEIERMDRSFAAQAKQGGAA